MKKLEINVQNGKAKRRKKPKFSFGGRNNKHQKDKKQKKKRIIGLSILLIVLAVGGSAAYIAYSKLRRSGININPATAITNTLTQKEPEMLKDENGVTSALLLGIDTRPSDPGLKNTDTIIIASYNHNTNTGTMISIPRDTLVYIPGTYNYTKINGVYNLCEASEEGGGIDCMRDIAKEITGLDIQYYAMVDIAGLVEAIDILGGVDVDVERSFTDYMFPTPEDTWEVISFEEGLQHMDGETAMKYARSRHAQGPEGSDFMRARRQQKLLIAAKNKALSMETLQDPIKVFELADTLGESVSFSRILEDGTKEDITDEDIRAAINLGPELDDDQIYSLVLDPTAANWSLITTGATEGYTLTPKAGLGNWEDVNAFITQFLENPGLYGENAKIYVYNGGLGYNETYLKYQELAEKYPYLQLTFGGNTYPQTYTNTTVFSFSGEPKSTTLDALKTYYSTQWTSEIPEGVSNAYAEDIMIIFGPVVETAPAATETTGTAE